MLFVIRDGNCYFKDIKYEMGTAESGDMEPERQGGKQSGGGGGEESENTDNFLVL